MRFYTRDREEDSELEKMLQGVFFSSSAVLYGGSVEGSEKGSPVYIVPVDFHDGVAFGKLKIDEKAEEVAIGLKLGSSHYRQDMSGRLIEENFVENSTLYIPLEQTRMLQRNMGGLSTVLGINGHRGLHPLLLASENHYTGLLLENGVLKPYKFQLPEMQAQIDAYMNEDGMQESGLDWENPKAIVAYLDEYVTGQHEAKRVIAVAFSSYMTKVRTTDDELLKTNLLLIGPSAVGKTYMISLLAKKAALPMVEAKLTGKSATGYYGENNFSALESMRSKTKGYAPYGIVFFDELDKMVRDIAHTFGPQLQDELIGWVEEAEVRGSPLMPWLKRGSSVLNTRNILFVTAGAFLGYGSDSLADIVAKRIGSGRRKIGFREEWKKEDEDILRRVTPEDIIAYGLKPELVGRLPCVAVLNSLTKDDKLQIMKNEKSSPLRSYVRLLGKKGYDARVDSDVLTLITEKSPKETGARGLKSVCINLFNDILYQPEKYAKGNIIHITAGLAGQLITLYRKSQE